MKVVEREGQKYLVMEIALANKPKPSSSGKTLLLASDSAKYADILSGKKVTVAYNVYMPNPEWVQYDYLEKPKSPQKEGFPCEDLPVQGGVQVGGLCLYEA